MLPFIRLNTDRFDIDPDTKVVKYEQYQAYLEATDLLDNIKAQQQSIEAKAELLYNQEKQRGYNDGRAEYTQEHIEHIVKTVSSTIDYMTDVENTMVNLVIESTRQLVGEFNDIELTLGIVKNALHLMGNEQRITLRIEPTQLDSVRSRMEEVLREFPAIGFIDVVADNRLSGGGCLLESPMGVIDASVNTQLSALKEALLNNFNNKAVKENQISSGY